jgi:hypothetical protein
VQLLSLEQSLNLDLAAANKLYSKHMNKYLLQVFQVLGLSEMDIKGAQGVEIWLNDGRGEDALGRIRHGAAILAQADGSRKRRPAAL